MQEILSKHCLTVARSVMNHKWAYPFNHPVDILQYKDYPTVVKTPMDLTTIRRKLENEMYRTPEEMAEDMRLVFSNAKLYNPPGSDVYVMATTVQVRRAYNNLQQYSILKPSPAYPPSSSLGLAWS